jgi:hypothetical protein
MKATELKKLKALRFRRQQLDGAIKALEALERIRKGPSRSRWTPSLVQQYCKVA